MGYTARKTVRVIRVGHEVTTFRKMTAKRLKEDLANVPDDAILLSFGDDDRAEANYTLLFQKEDEEEVDAFSNTR